MKKVISVLPTLLSVFLHFLEAFLHQKSYDIDALHLRVFLQASPVDFYRAVTTVRHQSEIQ